MKTMFVRSVAVSAGIAALLALAPAAFAATEDLRGGAQGLDRSAAER